MINYETPANFIVDHLRFSYRGEVFNGQGFMEWNPIDGFQINALLNKSFAPVDSFNTLGQIILNDKDDAFAVRMSIRGVGDAVAPNVFPLAQKRSLIPDNHLSIAVDRVIFFIKYPKEAARNTENWDGEVIYLVTKPFEFPDVMHLETTLSGQLLEKRGRTGLLHDQDEEWIVGRDADETTFKLNWSLPARKWTKTEAWTFTEAARRASSMVFSQMVWIRNAKVFRGHIEIHDWRKKRSGNVINFYYRPFVKPGPMVEQFTFNKATFLKLTRFLTKNQNNAEVCWRIFHQMNEAATMKTWQARELLLATILEAALRTLDNHPFRPGDRTWSRKESMQAFRLKYLTPEWELACQKALETHVRLRHRNAHPDWLSIPDGGLSKEQMKESTRDSVFLSRFYGYMILALAGFDNLRPLFPVVKFSEDAPPKPQLENGSQSQPTSL